MSWIPIPDLTPEEEEEMLDYMASMIKKYGMETQAIFFLESFKSFSQIGSYSLLTVAPFLELFGVNAYKYVALIGKKENLENLLRKLESM